MTILIVSIISLLILYSLNNIDYRLELHVPTCLKICTNTTFYYLTGANEELKVIDSLSQHWVLYLFLFFTIWINIRSLFAVIVGLLTKKWGNWYIIPLKLDIISKSILLVFPIFVVIHKKIKRTIPNRKRYAYFLLFSWFTPTNLAGFSKERLSLSLYRKIIKRFTIINLQEH